MADELFLKYCCLYKQLMYLSNYATISQFEELIKPCFAGDMAFQRLNQTMRIRTTVRWFRNNSQYNAYKDLCTTDVEVNQCDIPTNTGNIIYTCVWAFIMAMIFCSNLLVISSIIKVPHLRSNVANLFIMSLSFSDLCVGFFVVPLKLTFAKDNMRFCSSIYVCRFYVTTETAFFVTSIINLLVIAVDRHLALNYPYKYPNWVTRKRVKIIICFTWLYGFTVGALTNLKFDNIHGESIRIRGENCSMSNNIFYVYVLFLLHFGVPVLVMGIIYFRILMIAKHHARDISESSVLNNNNNNNSIELNHYEKEKATAGENKDEQNNNNDDAVTNKKNATTEELSPVSMTIANKNISKSDLGNNNLNRSASRYVLRRSSSRTMGQYRKLVLKATKIVAVVYGTFVISWFPTCVFSIALSICRPCYERVNHWFYIICIELLPITNSMLNVFIYAIMNNEFRRGFKKMLGSGKIVKSIKEMMHCQ